MRALPALRLLSILFLSILCSSPARAEQWASPTPEELALTSVPEAPGASAIYLFREQIADDKLHTFSIQARLKILTAAGADQGDIELRYLQGGTTRFSLDELSGRTIHPDGTVTPFTGKPYDKLISKNGSHKFMAKVFSLPDVTPGSVLEYRYKLHYNDTVYISPDWYVQNDLFTRRVHYLWRPTDKMLITDDDRQQVVSTISWTPILPAGATVKQNKDASGQLSFELTANNIPAIVHEDYAPPLDSFSYRVLFYLTPYRTREEFWSKEGKYWAKKEDKFIGPGNAVKAAAAELAAPTDPAEQRLHKFYVAVQKLDNTDNTRVHSSEEDKAQGLNVVRNTDDVWLRKRGSGDQITDLFVALARASGLHAYAMSVTRRNRSMFFESYLSTSQLDDTVAIVNVDGKDEFFDPGTHLCSFGELAWFHQLAGGLRQTDNGSAISFTPGASFSTSHVTRVADLSLDQQGSVTGSITVTYTGSPALRWRQEYASGDEASVRHDLTHHVEQQLPSGLKLTLVSLSSLDAPDQPLALKFTAEGSIGSAAGKRLVIPAALFESSQRPMFPQEKRELAVYFDYAFYHQDAVRLRLPANLTLESSPAEAKATLQNLAAYNLTSQITPNSVTVRRNEVLGRTLFLPSDYPSLRKFRQDIENADQESVVLKHAPASPQAAISAPSTEAAHVVQ